jgi:hypothetical protein
MTLVRTLYIFFNIMTCIPLTALLVSVAVVATARADEPILFSEVPPLIAAPNLKTLLDGSFRVAKGEWSPVDGEIVVVDLPEEKHIPVLHHLIGLDRAVIELEFQFAEPANILVGCDSDKHIGRVVINAAGMSIAEDSVKPSHTIANLKMALKPEKWHRLRVEWAGDKMAAILNGKELVARHSYLGTSKKRSWLAAGDGVRIRNLRISGIENGI